MPTSGSSANPQRWPWIVILRQEDRAAATGEHCPTSGAWTAPAWPSAAVVVLKGEIMPPLYGKAVEWHYTAELNPISALDLESVMTTKATASGRRRVPGAAAINGKEQGRESEIAFHSQEQ